MKALWKSALLVILTTFFTGCAKKIIFIYPVATDSVQTEQFIRELDTLQWKGNGTFQIWTPPGICKNALAPHSTPPGVLLGKDAEYVESKNGVATCAIRKQKLSSANPYIHFNFFIVYPARHNPDLHGKPLVDGPFPCAIGKCPLCPPGDGVTRFIQDVPNVKRSLPKTKPDSQTISFSGVSKYLINTPNQEIDWTSSGLADWKVIFDPVDNTKPAGATNPPACAPTSGDGSITPGNNACFVNPNAKSSYYQVCTSTLPNGCSTPQPAACTPSTCNNFKALMTVE